MHFIFQLKKYQNRNLFTFWIDIKKFKSQFERSLKTFTQHTYNLLKQLNKRQEYYLDSVGAMTRLNP